MRKKPTNRPFCGRKEHTVDIFSLKYQRVLRPPRLPLQDHCQSGPPRRVARVASRIDLLEQAGGLSPFLVVLVDALCTTIECAGVNAASCGIFDVHRTAYAYPGLSGAWADVRSWVSYGILVA